MPPPLDSIDIPGDRTLHLEKATSKWPYIRPLFTTYFPDGLILTEASKPDGVLRGTTSIRSTSVPVEAKFSGSEETTNLELKLTLDKLAAGGSGFRVGPSVTFKSNNGTPTTGGDLGAALELGSFEAVVSVLVPDLQIEAKLTHEAGMDASKITNHHSLGDLGKGLTITQIGLRADPWRGTYALALDAKGDWEIVSAKGDREIVSSCKLTGVSALILYSSEVRTTWASLKASVVLGGVDLVVTAAYDGSVSGWQFEGGTAPDQVIRIKDFIHPLALQLGVENAYPTALEGAEIHEIFASFNTETRDFLFRCETTLPLPGGDGKVLDIVLVIDIQGKNKKKSFRGTVTLGSLELDLIFDKEGKEQDQDLSRTVLLASYFDAEPRKLPLGELIATVSGDKDLMKEGDELSFSIKDALFAYEDGQWLLAAGFEAGMDFSGLPLIGASFPPGQGARLLFQPLLRSKDLKQTTVDAVRDLVPAGGLTLPEKLPTDQISLTTQMVLGVDQIRIGLPVHFSDGKMVDTPGGSVDHDSGATTQVDNVTWVPVQKAFGPVHLDRVGVGYLNGKLDFLLETHLTAAGLTLALQGFGVRVPLEDPRGVFPTLNGIGIDFRSSSVEIGGSLLHKEVTDQGKTVDVYLGTAIVKAGALTLEAMGSYQTFQDQPSLFLYARLDYLIGGPAFFFVTGLAAAFGYNRSFKLPPIERLAQFPLLPSNNGAMDYSTALVQLAQYIPPDLGAIFLGVGVRFTSFKAVESSALLTASFGKEFALNLIGRSTLVMPVGVDRTKAVAFVEMLWLASFRPAEGLLALRAQLTPESYIFSRDCHLTGGFAFYSWFPVDDPKTRGGADDHAGDFVLTLGGYHPDFDLALRPHYPQVPRLGIAWRVDDALSIKGIAYYVLTSSAAMAGGHLEAVWERHPYKAWFKAGIDCLFDWKPLHYQGEAYVEIGASYTFEFFGTRHITAEAGADVKIWGPPFSGVARVNLVLFSFDVSFGSLTKQEPEPVHLRYDYVDDGQTKGFTSLLPDEDKICGVSAKAGLVGTDDKAWVINPKELRLVVDSAIPSKQINVLEVGRDPDDPTKDPEARFGVAPMAAGPDQVESAMTIVIRKEGDGNWKPTGYFQYRLLTKGVPSALWGETTTKESNPNGQKLIVALAGVEIWPKGVPDTGDKGNWKEVELCERHKPTLQSGTYSIEVSQTLKAKGEPLPLTSPPRRFLVAGEQYSLPPSCIHSVFPPEGSLGDHSTALPHVILERSTLPWERTADATVATGADADTPWLALLVIEEAMEKAELASLPNVLGKVNFIEVEAKELPSAKELKLLSHVRVARVSDRDGNQHKVERAAVVAKRAPVPGKRSTVHLVSTEKRYEGKGGKVRLVSLWSWSFSCTPEQPGFERLLKTVKWESFAAKSQPLKHSREDGTRGDADYHGPLAPFSPTAKDGSDLVDVSHGAALELGRLLTLQNKSISVGLFRFKRSLSQHTWIVRQRDDDSHLYPGSRPSMPALPAEIEGWIEGLRKLEGVPFRYLLPQEKLLPVEAMRYFRLDDDWIAKLLEGALGVGGGVKLPVVTGPKPVTGIVLRSQVVGGWPAMNVEAFDKDDKPLKCRRTARLSRNILMVLFEGTIEKIFFDLPKESVHLDLSRSTGGKDWLSKAMSSVKLAEGLLKEQDKVEFKPIVPRNENAIA